MRTRLRKLFIVTVPALVAAIVLSMIAIEVWVRARWDERRGLPGFYLSDAELGQRLSPNYDGWFADVPVHVNSLGFRDSRDYTLEKPPNTFRILVLGDSVTFGHGALSETTYPYLLEQRLKAWRPAVNWQVWNLGVPGYNTATELKYLERVGPAYKPDLVIVGFFENDLTDNDVSTNPTFRRRLASSVQRSMQRWLYSYELYKRILLTIRFQWLTSAPDRSRLEGLAADDALLTPGDPAGDAQRQLSDVERFDEPFDCGPGDQNPNRDRLAHRLAESTPNMTAWKRSVSEFQRLHRDGTYRIGFFLNMAPNECGFGDRYVDHGVLEDEAALVAIMGAGTPVRGTARAFIPYRPSQMPGAGGHSVGNANRVKADALFEFVRDELLPDAMRR
jgi:hypothetical protein